jgi:hypothetical protein
VVAHGKQRTNTIFFKEKRKKMDKLLLIFLTRLDKPDGQTEKIPPGEGRQQKWRK